MLILELDATLGPNQTRGTSLVVICTRNREQQLRACIKHLEELEGAPREVLVVDSSEDSIAGVAAATPDLAVRIVHSNPGLPRQRNVAIGIVLKEYPSETILHFLDDDAFPLPGYFEAAEIALRGSEAPLLVGSVDVGLQRTIVSRVAILLGMKPKPGFVGRNGLSTPPTKRSGHVMWTPGHGMSLVPSRTPFFRFNAGIEFHGEDLEGSMRFAQHGQIVITRNSLLLHEPGPRSGTPEHYDLMEVEFRYFLARSFPLHVSRRSVETSIRLETFLLFAMGLFRADFREKAKSRIRAMSKIKRSTQIPSHEGH